MKNVINRAFAAKKNAIFFLFAILLFTSCEGRQGPQGPKGDGMNWKIVDISVKEWRLVESVEGNYYRSTWDVPELTEFVFTDGNVNGYIYLYDEKGAKYQHDLPYSLPIRVVENGQTFDYTRVIDFVYGVGWVELQLTNSDFVYPTAPEAMDFRIVMTW